ncbi:MAG TPA: nuclear transport factor 2 family protein [Sphingobium sp.]|nr:nuclear transport factor 2 family protein [Sphingobium sp.]
MAYTLQQLSDLEDIRTLKHRYFRGIDTADMALLETLFTADVGVDYRGGTYRARLSGRDNMMEFLANSFHSGVIAMHHGHMPEISLTGEQEATGIWYLEDIFIDVENRLHTVGTALYRDVYRREDGLWRIARTEYDRLYEIVSPLDPQGQITYHHLAQAGRKPQERKDISHLIEWESA